MLEVLEVDPDELDALEELDALDDLDPPDESEEDGAPLPEGEVSLVDELLLPEESEPFCEESRESVR